MDLLSSLQEISISERILQLERLDNGDVIPGDFEGSVKGSWVKLDSDGTGIVAYNDKQYKTKPLGLTSIPAGSDVELTHARGVYYSKY